MLSGTIWGLLHSIGAMLKSHDNDSGRGKHLGAGLLLALMLEVVAPVAATASEAVHQRWVDSATAGLDA